MEPVALPTMGLVYVDTNVAIYTVEKHPRFGPLLRPLWTAVSGGEARVLASEFALLEALVGPIESITNSRRITRPFSYYREFNSFRYREPSCETQLGCAALPAEISRRNSRRHGITRTLHFVRDE